MHEQLLSILKKEVKPALGCTGPVSVSYAASVAKDAVGGKVKSLKLIVDKDTYKNSISVGIPGTSQMGVDIAGALGAICGDSRLGLEVLKNITEEGEKNAVIFNDNHVTLEIKWDIEEVGLYIETFVETDAGLGHAIIVGTHTNVILIEANDMIIYDSRNKIDNKSVIEEPDYSIRKYLIKDFFEFSLTVPFEQIMFLKDSLDMNLKLAEIGKKHNLGCGFGNAFSKLKGDKAYLSAKILAASAADARMAGKDLPAMSCASSGNVGIAASIPLFAIAEEYNKSEEQLIRAVCLSFLLTIYIKSHIGRLSAMCACAIAAAVGVGSGTSFLLECSYEKIEMTINNIVGSLGGILCDGAKPGCALKLSTAAGIAIESAYLAQENTSVSYGQGIVKNTADMTLKSLGIIAREGMIETDKILCKVIINEK